jgi:hypothetical protein
MARCDGANGRRELAPLWLRLAFPQELLLLLKQPGLNFVRASATSLAIP